MRCTGGVIEIRSLPHDTSVIVFILAAISSIDIAFQNTLTFIINYLLRQRKTFSRRECGLSDPFASGSNIQIPFKSRKDSENKIKLQVYIC
jgi:hypothetical protein